MSAVYCIWCKGAQKEEDCWCVIDTKTHERYFECKKKCVETPVLVPQANLEPFELEIEDEGLSEESAEFVTYMEEPTPDWRPSHPQTNLLRRVYNWFTRPTGYTKVKTQ